MPNWEAAPCFNLGTVARWAILLDSTVGRSAAVKLVFWTSVQYGPPAEDLQWMLVRQCVGGTRY